MVHTDLQHRLSNDNLVIRKIDKSKKTMKTCNQTTADSRKRDYTVFYKFLCKLVKKDFFEHEIGKVTLSKSQQISEKKSSSKSSRLACCLDGN